MPESPRDMPLPDDAGPDAILGVLRDHPEWDEDEREAMFDRLIRRFQPAALLEAALGRIGDLGGADAESVLRIIEAHGSTESFQALAEALLRQPDLPAERAWEALAVLDYVGLLDAYPALAEVWDDLDESIDDEADTLRELVASLEEDDDGPSVALQGLHAVEPEIRVEIIDGLRGVEGGRGLVEFLRLLVFALEPRTREAALRALEDRSDDDPGVIAAWVSIAAEHDDPAVADRARAWLRRVVGPPRSGLPARLGDAPQLIRSSVTAVDGEGRATIVLLADSPSSGKWTGAAFSCHLNEGILDVVGHLGRSSPAADALFREFANPSEVMVVENRTELALGLLASLLAVTGPSSTPALRFWVERTAGPSFRAKASGMLDLFGEWEPADVPFVETPARVEAVLNALPAWVDRSEITKEIAREIALRVSGGMPDPRRDAGAYRYFFEHHLHRRLELHRRMLYWMAAFWRASGEDHLGRSAHALAWQLADPQHAVPSHPFLVSLTTRSLLTAHRPETQR